MDSQRFYVTPWTLRVYETLPGPLLNALCPISAYTDWPDVWRSTGRAWTILFLSLVSSWLIEKTRHLS